MSKSKSRYQLLTEKEYQEQYGLPRFCADERPLFFHLNAKEFQCLQTFRQLKSKVFFILQLGYFRDKQQFFDVSLSEVKRDVNFILKHYFNDYNKKIKLTGKLGRDKLREQRNLILTLCEYQLWSTKTHSTCALAKLVTLLRRYPKGNDTFREFLLFLEQQRITTPSYRLVQDLFTQAFSQERQRLEQQLTTLTESQQAQLNTLIDNDDGLSQLNLIRYDQADFSYYALKAELQKLYSIYELYTFSQTIIPTLGLSCNAVRYYASVAEQYSAARLRKLSSAQQSLYILCFVYHRYREFVDNLITSFLYYVKDFKERSKKYAKEAEATYYKELGLDLPELAAFLHWYADAKPDGTLSSLAFQQKGFDILSQEKQQKLAEYLAGHRFDKVAAQWDYYEQHSRRLALFLRPILIAIPFTFHKEQALLSQLMKALRKHYSKGGIPKILVSAFPSDLLKKLPKKTRHYLFKANGSHTYSCDPARLEFYIYDKMANQINYGRLFCHDSVNFDDLDADLVEDSLVDNIKQIAKECNRPKLAVYCDQRLDDAIAELDQAWETCNDNIAHNRNEGLSYKVDNEGQMHWSLSYDANNDAPSYNFFKQIKPREIAEIIKEVGDKLDIWPCFQHKLFRYLKHAQVEATTFIAGLLSEAFGLGDETMAERSNISLSVLQALREDYLYSENLVAGNAKLGEYIDQLPVSRAWDLYKNKRVADGDGQKFITKFHTLQSRFSAKYYRTRKGISIYTLVANHIPINAQAIGPHQHESHFLFDAIYNNPTNIPIDFVTGDNHSINQMNYIATDLIDTEFIPNIKQIREEADKLYCVSDPNTYSGFLTPCGQVDLDLICSEKRGILRVLISLLLQENTQAVIIRKLSSHKRYSRLQRALWEYCKIFRSTHILNVINDAQLRKVIKTARNRTESYHQLQRSLRKVGSGFFKGRRIIENQMSCQATRLVASFIIAYNATLLNGVYLRLIKRLGEVTAQSVMASISPVVWSHILLTGLYHFKEKGEKIDIDSIIQQMESYLNNYMI